ncbi:MAG: indolepyruvate ferredoxin oxidoreductase [Bacteroidetes bacterium]|nr:MAG: indolepyruvate ferredoxin oxidoreductase [Bacteroidota bacterium]
MNKILLLGDEAIALGAIDGGLSGVFAYPGTPSTEITEYIQASKEAKALGIKSEWSTNEKTAMETGIGMSYAGKKAMVCMKHVGLNVAADAFMNSAITGTNGGLVVVSADDPSMHSSQNEQDSRFYGKFAMIPILEPTNQQEAYNMAYYGLTLSEKFGTPVMIRVTTRLAHSRSGVERKERIPQNKMHLPGDHNQFILLPAMARKSYSGLLGKQSAFESDSETAGFNTFYDGDDKSLGIIACGLTYNYLIENFEEGKVPYPVLKIGQYPTPSAMVNSLYEAVDEILVLEEGAPLVEEMLRGLLNKGKKIRGRMEGSLPRAGELNPNLVAQALGMPVSEGYEIPSVIKGRPPVLCDGCPHIDSFEALNDAMKPFGRGHVFSDIGCYTLSALKPLESIDSCVDMGASITMAVGAAESGLSPAIAVIGDSTFTHSGMTGLLDAVVKQVAITVFILDNATVGMTGGQRSAALGRIEDICKGIGVEEAHIRVVKPLRRLHDENLAIYEEEIAYNGVSVIIPRRECVQTLSKRMKLKAFEKRNKK